MTFPLVNWTDIAWDELEPRTLDLHHRGGEVYLVVHHGVARTIQQIIGEFHSPSRSVSATFAFGPTVAGSDDIKVALTVPEDMRPYTTASWIDNQALTVEVANLELGGTYPVSANAKELLAQLAAYMHTEYGMPLDRWHVTSHQEVYARGWGSYPTACPGPDLQAWLDWIVARAIDIVNNTNPTPAPVIPKEFGMAQRMYFARIDEAGADNGEWMLAGADMGRIDEKQDGYIVTTDKEVAKVWARQYSFRPDVTGAVRLTRDLYIAQQEFARRDAADFRANMRALLTP